MKEKKMKEKSEVSDLLKLAEMKQRHLREWFADVPSITHSIIHRLGQCEILELKPRELHKYAQKAHNVSNAYKQLEVILTLMYLTLERAPEHQTRAEKEAEDRKQVNAESIKKALSDLGIIS